MRRGVATGKSEAVKPIKKMVGPYAPINGERRRANRGFTLAHLIFAVLVGVLGCMGVVLMLVQMGMLVVDGRKGQRVLLDA
jgi:hypothetical protein